MYSSARQRSSQPPPSSSQNRSGSGRTHQQQQQQSPYYAGSSQRQRQKDERSTRTPPENKKKRQNQQTLLLVSASLLALAAWYLTPLSDYVVEILLLQVPIEADIELGKQVLREEVSRQTVFHPEWTPQLQSIGWDLVDSAANAAKEQSFRSSSSTARTTTNDLARTLELANQYEWDFGVLKDPDTVNAFALPGGAIRVTTGLLQKLQLTSGELAALIGHEMGHVLHRHSQARILQQQFLSKVLQAAVYKDDDPHQESFGEALGELLLSTANWLGSQSFSRSNEYEADAAGWQLLVESKKFHPKALESLLTKLWEYHGRQGGKTSWESTHPGTIDRIKALKDKWKALAPRERWQLNQHHVSL